jgi:M6 family metalloprotease-like protein
MPPSRWFALTLVIASWAPGLSAQDVEMLGQRHGTRPPDGYYRELAQNPDAYRFTRGRAARLRELMEQSAAEALRPLGPALSLGPRTGPVVGDVHNPVILGLFDESPAPTHPAATIQGAYFGAQPGAATVSTYYAEVSSDSITLDGDVRDWVRSTRTAAQTTQDQSALVCCGIGDFIKDLLSLQTGVDWGAYDNDGPDGVPNSGDDDGYVDALAVMHPTPGAECNGSTNRIWSHKWALSDASTSRTPYQTGTPSASGGLVRVDDYFVQGVEACSGGGLNPIGVFVHETGHAFGLPDLYDTRQGASHAGAGIWDLMASGTWGCNNDNPARPCHLGAWSKAMLGWVDVITLPPDTDLGALQLPPVETTGTVFRVDAADGSDEYFLLENRQDVPARLFDKNLFEEGLLVWQVDWGAVLARWPSNTVNASSHMAVWLRQADGRDDLSKSPSLRGDSGDPFPGATGNTQFHAATNPAARSHLGTAVGLAVLEIARPGDDVSFRVVTGLTLLAVSPQSVPLTATLPLNVQLTAQNATPPVTWLEVGGSLPDGLALSVDGRMTGSAIDLGTFQVTVEATDAIGLTATATLTLDVGAPSIAIADLASVFLLRGPSLAAVEIAFLDRHGNGNGAYDLGDFRAWVLANPSLPLSAELASLAGQDATATRTPTVPVRPAEPGPSPGAGAGPRDQGGGR